MSDSELRGTLDRIDNVMNSMRRSIDDYSSNVANIQKLHSLIVNYGIHSEERILLLQGIFRLLLDELTTNRQSRTNVGTDIERLDEQIRDKSQTITTLNAQIDRLTEFTGNVKSRADRQLRTLQELQDSLNVSNRSLQDTYNDTNVFYNRLQSLNEERTREINDMQDKLRLQANMSDKLHQLENERTELQRLLNTVTTISTEGQ
jgi:chromosome segregation ATPase